MKQGTLSNDSERTAREHEKNARPASAHDTAQKAAHLYVLASETGLVKIGRSRAPMKRKWGLESNSGLRLSLVRILRGEGHRERTVLKALVKHRHQGEWFKDSPEFRMAATQALGVDLKFRWAAKIDANQRSGMRDAVRAMCIESLSPVEIERWDEADIAYDRFFLGEITLEELNVFNRRAKHRDMTEEEARRGP